MKVKITYTDPKTGEKRDRYTSNPLVVVPMMLAAMVFAVAGVIFAIFALPFALIGAAVAASMKKDEPR